MDQLSESSNNCCGSLRFHIPPLSFLPPPLSLYSLSALNPSLILSNTPTPYPVLSFPQNLYIPTTHPLSSHVFLLLSRLCSTSLHNKLILSPCISHLPYNLSFNTASSYPTHSHLIPAILSISQPLTLSFYVFLLLSQFHSSNFSHTLTIPPIHSMCFPSIRQLFLQHGLILSNTLPPYPALSLH